MLEWLKDQALTLLMIASTVFASFLVVYKKHVILELRVKTLEDNTVKLEKEIKEELKEIKEDIKKLLAR